MMHGFLKEIAFFLSKPFLCVGYIIFAPITLLMKSAFWHLNIILVNIGFAYFAATGIGSFFSKGKVETHYHVHKNQMHGRELSAGGALEGSKVNVGLIDSSSGTDKKKKEKTPEKLSGGN